MRNNTPPSNIAPESRRPPGRHGTPADDLHSPSTAGLRVNMPSQRRPGQDPTPTSYRSAPDSRHHAVGSEAVNEGTVARTAVAAGTAAVVVEGQHYDGNYSDRGDTSDNERHFREYFHRHEYKPGHGMYNPPKLLDEWRKGTVGTLSGTMLDLGDETTPSMDKRSQTWGDRSSSQRQASISSRPRKAEAFDGEYDETNCMYTSVDTTDIVRSGSKCSNELGRSLYYDEVVTHARGLMGHQVTAVTRKARRRGRLYPVGRLLTRSSQYQKSLPTRELFLFSYALVILARGSPLKAFC